VYYLDEFDGLALICLETDAGGQAAGDFLAMAAGQFDANGAEPTYQRGLSVQAKLLMLGGTPAEMAAAARAFQAKLGKRGKLYRTWRDAQREWVYGRLVEIAGTASGANITDQEVKATWRVESPLWSGEDVVENAPSITTSPQNVVLANAGNARVNSVIITVTGTATPITSVKFGVAGVSEIEWVGSLGSGHDLVIDCGARSVKKDGVDDYDAFSLTVNHIIGDWLRLEPGNNTVVVTIGPGGALPADVEFEYYDAWR
jgi:hypothetical protein